ncbi:hypothetical protein [Nocardia yunnanensis]|nr:hypothetical protein [Nocardia yunnanensis]
MDADFTAGPGDSRPARQPGYRLTHPDSPTPGTSPNPVLTGIDTGLGRNGHDPQAVQWSSAPVTLRATPESEGLSRRLAPDLPQRTADPEAVAARLAADGEPFAAIQSESFGGSAVTNGSLYARSMPDSDAYAPAVEDDDPLVRPGVNGSSYGRRAEANEDVFGASPALDLEPPTNRRYAPDPEPPARPARLDQMEAIAASLREGAEDEPVSAARPAPAPSRRRAAPEPAVAQHESAPAAESAAAEANPAAKQPVENKAAEFRTSEASVDLHHIMRLLTASHDLDRAAAAAESGEITVAEFAAIARRTRTAAVDLVAAWYGGADHMRKFGEVLLQAAAESSPRT